MTDATNNILNEVTIYTDGGCDPNPGYGGYGVVLINGKHKKELSGGFRLTTNNRMELLATIEGLKALNRPCKVTLFSDSKYVVDAINKGWARKWKRNGWWRNNKDKALNPDLWDMFLNVYDKHEVDMKWVKGHAGIEYNERCDTLATMALKSKNLPIDEGYENPNENYYLPRVKENETAIEPQKKIKITEVGQPCRKCSTPVIKRIPKFKLKPGQKYYYLYFLYCPNCKHKYMVDKAKKKIEKYWLIK